MFLSREDAKAAGYFSRRHVDTRASTEARARYQLEHGPAARKAQAKLCAEERAKRSDAEQLELIKTRRGNSKREVARLQAKKKK